MMLQYIAIASVALNIGIGLFIALRWYSNRRSLKSRRSRRPIPALQIEPLGEPQYRAAPGKIEEPKSDVEQHPIVIREGEVVGRLESISGPSWHAHYAHLKDLSYSSKDVTLSDNVHFAVTAPKQMAVEEWHIIDFWIFREDQRAEVVERVKESSDGRKFSFKERGPVSVLRGTPIEVRMHVSDLQIAESAETLIWLGEIASAQFAVHVPPGTARGSRPGVASVFVNGFQIARVAFVIEIGLHPRYRDFMPTEVRRFKSAFASYAHEDNDEVLHRIQGMQKACPGFDVFFDQASIRSGEDWKEKIRKEIIARDVLYLFWSVWAAKSEWVDREWRCAFQEKGRDGIDPVPLVSPTVAPPPKELADLHFGDWMLNFKRAAKLSQ